MVVSANGLRDGEKEELADLAQDARRFSKQTLRRYQNGHRELVLITHSNSNFLRILTHSCFLGTSCNCMDMIHRGKNT